MLSLQQLTLKVSVIQKILLSEQTLLIQWSVKTFFAILEIILKSNPEFKWLSENVKTIYMFVGDVVAATLNTKSICHTKNFTVRTNTAYTVVCQNFFRNYRN